jgi:hypothetical protein
MLSFLKSLFSRAQPPRVTLEIAHFEQLAGHRFAYHEEKTGVLTQEVEVRPPDSQGYLAVVTTRYASAGAQVSTVSVNAQGVIADCPEFGEQYVGRQDCLWLPPSLRRVGASAWIGMLPSQVRVMEETSWLGIPVWRCEYKVFGNTCFLCYDLSSGIKVGQHAVGQLASCSLGLTLPP